MRPTSFSSFTAMAPESPKTLRWLMFPGEIFDIFFKTLLRSILSMGKDLKEWLQHRTDLKQRYQSWNTLFKQLLLKFIWFKKQAAEVSMRQLSKWYWEKLIRRRCFLLNVQKFWFHKYRQELWAELQVRFRASKGKDFKL